jgi:hypothetical protein
MWGESVASFGGMYHTDGEEELIVLFTGDPELHRAEVSRHTPVPERLILRRTSRSQAEIHRSSEAVAIRLMTGSNPHPSVRTVGPTLDGDEWVITVGIDPYTEEIAAEVRDLASPELIKVVYEPGRPLTA